jgi:excisionase family DNA binding protein
VSTHPFHEQVPQMRWTALGAGIVTLLPARLGIGRDDRQVEDGAMATLWSCPKSDCPPTEIAPVDVPESGEAAGAESERPFTTDEVAALLNVPPDTIYKWHKEGTGPPGYQMHKESHYRRSDVVRWLAEQGVTLAVCQSDCGRTYTRNAFKTMPGP